AVDEDAAARRREQLEHLPHHDGPMQCAHGSYPVLRHLEAVLIEPGVAGDPLCEALLVPDLEELDLAEDADFADYGRAVAQLLRQHHAALSVEVAGLPEISDPIEEFDLRGMAVRHQSELGLDLDPDGYGVDANRIAGHAGDEHVGTMDLVDRPPVDRRDLEPA